MKRLLIIAIVSLLGLLTVHAEEQSVDDQGNPNDPAVNERANACYAGAAWEYTCGDDLYMWDAGWYYIRLQAGIFSVTDIPSGFWWIIGQDGSTSGGSGSSFSVCKEFYILLGRHYYVSFDAPTGDLEVDGDVYWIDDPTCSPSTVFSTLSGWRIAFAPSGAAQANTLCGAAPIRQHSADVFICQGA
ncbi:MAG: hypothetical protein U0694_26795 [Anaerolineae bacterium]